MLLSAIGIFMVVDHHTFTALNMFGDYMPYNSFFMPMFVFISGYFNKVDSSTNLLKYFWKKIRNLLIPYIGLSILVFLIQQLLDWIKIGQTPEIPSWYVTYMLQRIITVGSFASIAGPMWFVIALFATLIVYSVLKKLLSKIWVSHIMLIVFVCLHLLSIYLAKTIPEENMDYFLVLLKVMFFLPFIEMGIIYRENLEQGHSKMPVGGKVALLFGLLIFNAVRTMYLPMPYDIAFDSIDEMAGFTSPYLITPIESAVIGIAFWLTLTDLIGKSLYESKFINYMSCNTFWIMGLHVAFFNILNLILMLVSENIVYLPYFDSETFRETEWYFWDLSPSFKLVYVVIGILGPLGLKWIFDRLVLLVGKLIKKNKTQDIKKAVSN